MLESFQPIKLIKTFKIIQKMNFLNYSPPFFDICALCYGPISTFVGFFTVLRLLICRKKCVRLRFFYRYVFFLKNFRKIFFRPKRLEMAQNVPKKIFRKIFFVLPLALQKPKISGLSEKNDPKIVKIAIFGPFFH